MDVLERLAGERGGLTSYNLCACTICDAYREIVRLRGQVEALRKELKQAEKDAREDARDAAAQARHEERYPDEPYGTY